MKPRLWPVLLASGVGLVILLWLGVWQVQRLQWKEALIAEMDSQLANGKMSLAGKFDGQPLRKITTLNGGPGFEIIQAFTMEDGGSMLVVRGIAGEGQSPPPLENPIIITGITKTHDGGQGLFDPDNDATANRWYWWDVPAMYQASAGAAVRHATEVLHLLPVSPGTEGLFVEQPKANLRNNHLGYAVSWFGLAAVLVVMTGVFLRQRHKT